MTDPTPAPTPAPAPAPDVNRPFTVDLPLSEAAQELTGFEVLAVEKHFDADFDKLGGVKTLLGAIWAFGNRDGRTLSWNAVKALSLKQMNGIFAPEPKDVDADDPDSDVGKGSSRDAAPLNGSRTGASALASDRTSITV